MSGSISPGGGIACARRGEVLQPQGSAYRITKDARDSALVVLGGRDKSRREVLLKAPAPPNRSTANFRVQGGRATYTNAASSVPGCEHVQGGPGRRHPK